MRGLTRRRIGDDGRLCWGLAWPGIARRLFPRDKPPRQSPDCDPQVRETVKRTVRPYFELDGNICALLATRDHVNIFLYDGGIVPDPEALITGGHHNATARTVAVREGEPINVAALREMFIRIIANNRAGGWLAREVHTPDPGRL